jgi:hypothetical protein
MVYKPPSFFLTMEVFDFYVFQPIAEVSVGAFV